MTKKHQEIRAVKTLSDADAALAQLAEINAGLDIIQGKQSKEEIERLKNMEKHAIEAAPLLNKKGKLLKALEAFAVKNREKVFGPDQSIKLKNGRFGWQKSKKALAKKKDNPLTEEEIAQKIWIELGDKKEGKNCIERSYRMKKEEIKKRFNAEMLEEYGLYILQIEAFFAEDKQGVRF